MRAVGTQVSVSAHARADSAGSAAGVCFAAVLGVKMSWIAVLLISQWPRFKGPDWPVMFSADLDAEIPPHLHSIRSFPSFSLRCLPTSFYLVMVKCMHVTIESRNFRWLCGSCFLPPQSWLQLPCKPLREPLHAFHPSGSPNRMCQACPLNVFHRSHMGHD